MYWYIFTDIMKR